MKKEKKRKNICGDRTHLIVKQQPMMMQLVMVIVVAVIAFVELVFEFFDRKRSKDFVHSLDPFPQI